MRKEEGIIAVVIIGLALLFTFVLNIQFTGLVVFDQSNQTHFDEGTYVNTTYNGSAIVLNESQTNGKYTSKIFDAGEESSWDSLTWNGSAPSTVTNSLSSATHDGSPVTELDTINASFYSANLTLASLQLNFTGNLENGATLELHAKTNVGSGSVEIQNSSGSVLGSFVVTSDVGENISVELTLDAPLDSVLLVGEGNESTVDFDFASSENPSGISLDFQTRICSDLNCTNSSFEAPADLNDLGLTGQYFQYMALFSGTSSSPSLGSVSVESSLIPIVVTISEPKGTKESASGIPIQFSTDSEATSCHYNVEDTLDGSNPLGNTTLVDCGNSTFDLPDEGAYIFNLYVESPAGVTHETSAFTVDEEDSSSTTSTTTATETDSSVQVPVTSGQSAIQITAEDIGAVSLNSGDSESVQWIVSSTGTGSLSACSVMALGDFASWVSASEDTLNINGGESGTFLFDVLVPEGTAEGSYTLSVSVECAEMTVSKDFTVEVVPFSEATSEGTTGTGFAVGGIGTGGVIIIIVVVVALVTLLLVSRRMRRSGKTLRDVFNSVESKFHR